MMDEHSNNFLDVPDKAPGSKVLKKARSFRDDLKVLIKRRPSASQVMVETKTKTRNSKSGSESDCSMMDHCERIKRVAGKERISVNIRYEVRRIVDTSTQVTLTQLDSKNVQDLDKLQVEVNNVNRTLNFIKQVLAQGKLQILPGSASVILESVMEIFTLLSMFLNQESTSMVSRHNQVCQCLAKFIQWTDAPLLHTEKPVSKEASEELITSLSEGLKELMQLYKDKLERKNVSSAEPASPGPQDNLKRSSLPELPLTPREKEILANTSDIGIYDNPHVSHSSDSITNMIREETPPPKPPLPNVCVVQRLIHGDEPDGLPPPIPEKRRSGPSILDSLQNNSLLLQNNVSVRPEGDITPANTSFSHSPHSSSPSSSIGSGLNQSTEDLLNSSGGSHRAAIHSQTVFQAVESRSSKRVVQTMDEINALTSKINRLTSGIEEKPPPLPNKRVSRQTSQYDNIDSVVPEQCSEGNTTVVMRSVETRSSSQSMQSVQSFPGLHPSSSGVINFEKRSSSQETYSSSETFSSASHSSMESLPKPPPLPLKKRQIQEYIQIFESCQPSCASAAASESISRHSINFYEAQWQQHQNELTQPLYPRSNTISVISDLSNFGSDVSFSSGSESSFLLPALPVKKKHLHNRHSLVSTLSSLSDSSANEFRDKSLSMMDTSPSQQISDSSDMEWKRSSAPVQLESTSVVEQLPEAKQELQKDTDSDFVELNSLDDIDVSDQLVKNKPGDNAPEIRGGTVDALIVHATVAGKTKFIYQEAFLTTYRTFITPQELIEKLLYRFHKFHHVADAKKRLARNAFSLLIRVVDELSAKELTDKLLGKMMELVFELLCRGELQLARILRRKVIEKCDIRKTSLDANQNTNWMTSIQLQSNPIDLLHCKSHDIAEQMTLLDAELFQKIEIPEVLLWAKEQSEELSPNLTKFTEHFNKMSYWCRTKILRPELEAKERERYLMKFIKIMRHLRKLSNFNSYLAILSALDSAPVRRLEWQKQNVEALKEFCQLIDSTAAFRAYRQALAETEPPCIPYIGLVLQDLTFINIGNQDYLSDGLINFAKRWQQFNILDSMRRFKKCNFDIKKNEKIVGLFNSFEDYLSEEALWQISERLRPRGGDKKIEHTDSHS